MSTSEVALFQQMLTDLAAQGVSDLYLRPAMLPLVRRDGELEQLAGQTVVSDIFLEAILAWLLTPEQKQKLESEKQLTIGYTFANHLRLRLNVFYQHGLPELTIRFVPLRIKKVSELGLPPNLEQLMSANSGLVIISGPYGSGRSATIAALLQTINNTSARHIVTIEEPIEYVFTSNKSVIDQREVGQDVNSWEAALQSLPQEDCDVVVLGKVPRPALAAQALELAAAGKLVLMAAEADSTVKCLERLVTSFLPDEQTRIRDRLGEVLLAVLAQQLIKRIGGGRLAVTELLLGTPAVRNIVREGKFYQLNNVLQISRDEGMLAFDYNLAELVKTGLVQAEEAALYVHDNDLFNSFMRSL